MKKPWLGPELLELQPLTARHARRRIQPIQSSFPEELIISCDHMQATLPVIIYHPGCFIGLYITSA
jgi:hypothetical protein